MFTGPKTAKTQTATSSGRFLFLATSDPLFQCCRSNRWKVSKQDKVQMRGASCIYVLYRNLEPLIIYKTNMHKQAGNRLTWPVCHFVIFCLFQTNLFAFHALPSCPLSFQERLNLSKRQLVYCPLWSQRQFASNTTDLLSLEHPDVSQVQRGISGWYSSSCTPPQNKIRRTIHLDSFFLAKATMRP